MLLTTVQTSRRNSRSATRRAAFTLLEVLIVVAILVILASAASIALFRYLEDAKIGRAKVDMQTITKAYQTYYSQKGQWPDNIQEVAPYLEQGNEALLDPWRNPYTMTIATVQQSDGSTIQRPVAYCQPPNGRPQIQWPEQGR